ncbi:hypothetical protein [Nocardia sp. NPDC049707]
MTELDESAVDRRIQDMHDAFVADLGQVLDIEAGLREVFDRAERRDDDDL